MTNLNSTKIFSSRFYSDFSAQIKRIADRQRFAALRWLEIRFQFSA
jgi:hypothetical protein